MSTILHNFDTKLHFGKILSVNDKPNDYDNEK